MSKTTKPIAGVGAVKYVKNRSTEWYCGTCACFIRPIWIRVGKMVHPACRECFFDDMPFCGKLVEVKEEDDVATLVGVVETGAENSDLPAH